MLLLDEPDNYLDVPGKRWLEPRLVESPKTVLFVSHDRELLDHVATRIATLEPSRGGNTVWVHPGRFSTYEDARADRNARLEELRRRWDEEHVKLKELVVMYRQKATYNDGMASRLRAAETRLRRFEEAGPPEAVPLRQKVVDAPGRRAHGQARRRRDGAELRVDGGQLMQPFDAEIWFGERVGILGSNGSGKSHFLRLLAAGAPTPTGSTSRSATSGPRRSSTRAGSCSGRGCGPGGSRRPTTTPRSTGARCSRSSTAATTTATACRARSPPGRSTATAWRRASEQTFDSLSGGQQARLQILLLELSGATMLLLDEPTDNLDLHSAEALEDALAAFEGTVLAVTHDRWFARGLDRFLVFRADGRVVASDEPVWDEGRVAGRAERRRRRPRPVESLSSPGLDVKRLHN